MVFVFFGLMATCGTAFVMVGDRARRPRGGAGRSLGLLAVAILVANNLRDIPTDAARGKRTLAVRLGDRAHPAALPGVRRRRVRHDRRRRRSSTSPTRRVGIPQWALFGLAAWPLAIRPMEARRLGHRARPDPGAHRHGRHPCRVRLLTALGLVLSAPSRWSATDVSLGDALARVRVGAGGRARRRRGPARMPLPRLSLDAARAGAGPAPRRRACTCISTSARARSSRSGLAKATRRARSRIACTSGTAAAESCPAVVEASQSRVPLVVLTADRPPRLRGTGANQTIDQVGLYGRYVRAYLDLPVPGRPGQEAWWRQRPREALEATRRRSRGPVHVNCPFEEPLTPSASTSPSQTSDGGRRACDRAAEPTVAELDRLVELASGARGMTLFGGGRPSTTRLARFWCEVLRLAGRSPSRRRALGVAGIALAAGQALLGSPMDRTIQRPDVVVQFGAAPTTRAPRHWWRPAPNCVVVDRFHLEPDVYVASHAAVSISTRLRGSSSSTTGTSSGASRSVATRSGSRPPATAPRVCIDEDVPRPPRGTRRWHEGLARADGLARTTMDALARRAGTSRRAADRPRRRGLRSPRAARCSSGNSIAGPRPRPRAWLPRDGSGCSANRGASGIDGLRLDRPRRRRVRQRPDVRPARGPVVRVRRRSSAVEREARGRPDWSSCRQRPAARSSPARGLGTGQLFLTPHGLTGRSSAGVVHERVERRRPIPASERADAAGAVRRGSVDGRQRRRRC